MMLAHVGMYGVRYFFSEAARAGRIAGFDSLDACDAGCIAVLHFVAS